MPIGVVLPQVEIGPDPARIRDYAQAVEEMGYRHVRAFDHVLCVNTMGMGLTAPEDHSRMLERFKKEAMG